jgi:hypothetical protein
MPHLSELTAVQTAKDATQSIPQPEWNPEPFEIAALATAIWGCHSFHQEPDRIGRAGQTLEPKDFLEDACELLIVAQQVVCVQQEARKSKVERENAIVEREQADGKYDPGKRYAWNEVLKVQSQIPHDESSTAYSEAKFAPCEKWPRMESKLKSGEFYFTEKNLAHRPLGYSMVGTIASDKGLRNAIKRLFGKDATKIIESKKLSLWQINEILIDQLRRNRGKVPKARPSKTTPV